jgi:hypothetical protein
LIKSLLLIFVILSLGVLIYKEFSPKSESNATDVAVLKSTTTPVSGKSLPAPVSQASKNSATKEVEAPASQIAVTSHNATVIAYYFHGTFRCSTCRTIEQYSHEAIQMYFAKELGNGRLEFRPVNIDEPENKH